MTETAAQMLERTSMLSDLRSETINSKPPTNERTISPASLAKTSKLVVLKLFRIVTLFDTGGDSPGGAGLDVRIRGLQKRPQETNTIQSVNDIHTFSY